MISQNFEEKEIKQEIIEETDEENSSQGENSISTPPVPVARPEKRKSSFSLSDNVCPTKKPNMHTDNFTSRILEQLQEISSRLAQVVEKEQDSYDHFGKYIASLLRIIGHPDSMVLQSQITTLITNKLCGSPNQND